MDYLALAGAFANIVSLIGMFKSEHQANSVNQYGDFLKWLEEHHHNDVLQAIQANHLLMQSLQNLLQNNHDELMEKILKIDTLLLEISSNTSNINGFAELANSFTHQIQISEQAKSILSQFYTSGGSYFMERKTNYYDELIISDAKGNNRIQLSEPRFLEEDLEQLYTYGLLRLDFTSRGNRRFYITRLGVKLASQI